MSGAPLFPASAYRPCVGIALFDRRGLVFAGRRLDMPFDAWQMPQGGIDAGETPRRAALRELVEETGTDKAEIVAEIDDWLAYDLPPELAARSWGGRYRGQRQKWFALAFAGADSDIVLDAHEAEFAAWQWMKLGEVARGIVAFKREVYARVAEEFAPIARKLAKAGGE